MTMWVVQNMKSVGTPLAVCLHPEPPTHLLVKGLQMSFPLSIQQQREKCISRLMVASATVKYVFSNDEAELRRHS